MMDLGQLHKTTEYKNQGTPYSLTRTITENGQPDILFHWHTDVEIIYVHEGSAQFHIDDHYFNSHKGDIVLIRPNALHSIHPIEQQRHYMDAINFHLDLMGYSAMDHASIHSMSSSRLIKPMRKFANACWLLWKPVIAKRNTMNSNSRPSSISSSTCFLKTAISSPRSYLPRATARKKKFGLSSTISMSIIRKNSLLISCLASAATVRRTS